MNDWVLHVNDNGILLPEQMLFFWNLQRPCHRSRPLPDRSCFVPPCAGTCVQVKQGRLEKPEAHIVSWRGNFSKIMCTPYSSGKDDWEIAGACG